MNGNLQHQAETYAIRKQKRKNWHKIVTILAAIVVFCTTYALILPAITEEAEPTCGFVEHQHTAECLESEDSETYLCGMEEHIHDEIACYLNQEAVLETQEEWEASLPERMEEEDGLSYLLSVAKSQLEYQESETAVTLDSEGNQVGATRYGIWYGDPYGKWDTMFIAFCLEYAGITEEDAPRDANSSQLLQKYEELGQYHQMGGEYVPKPGDLVFFDLTSDGSADRVGLIAEVNEETAELQTIEGDTAENKVAYQSYDISDVQILGYGTINFEEETDVQSLSEEEIENDQASEPAGQSEEGADEQISSLAIEPRATYYVWLDGTNGGLMGFEGSPNTRYEVKNNSFTLPETWNSPAKYNYTLRGWYDVIDHTYYKPGDTVSIRKNKVFYADWRAASYDVGQNNTHVVGNFSTKEYITTRVFDYGALFNVMSSSPGNPTVGNNSHSETWATVNKGNTVPYQNMNSLYFVFRDWDTANKHISYPSNRGDANDNRDVVTKGLYSEALHSTLFGTNNSFDPATGTGIIGKEYLGTADYLFQIMPEAKDPDHKGYHYYDSKLNAASYNQKDGRFYVYDYLERTSDSAKDGGGGEYSDFLPFNSPYVNNNGKTVRTYNYNNKTNYQYDAKYTYTSSGMGGSSTSNAGTNYWFGMSIDIKFFLPEKPGTNAATAANGNKDSFGQDLHFKFSGDDDVWVLVDGKLVLDIGGVHGIKSGDINFTTGEVTVASGTSSNGTVTSSLSGVSDGNHTLTVLYLERGGSQSNCAIYFNVPPTPETTSVDVQKVWTDKNKVDHTNDSVTVYLKNGNTIVGEAQLNEANGWKYKWEDLLKYGEDGKTEIEYTVEEAAKDGYTSTITKLTNEGDEEGHSFVVTNTPIREETSLKVIKKWDLGSDDISDDIYKEEQVTVKLLADGTDTGKTVILNLQNNWQATFENLSHKDDEGNIIVYTVEEVWETEDWVPSYGEIIKKDGTPGTYEVTITNTYRWGYIHELPATGGPGTEGYIIGGFLLAAIAGTSLLCRRLLKRRRV